MKAIRFLKTATASSLAVFLCSCAMLDSRPVKQMAYAESAYQGALLAGAETNPAVMPIFLLAKDQLSRARSYYRLKNFKDARLYAVKSRRLFEEAEWKSMGGESGSNEVESLVK